jgi:hypothetical protein
MNIRELVDELYEAFAQRLGEPLAGRARDLPRALRLVTEPNLPWSRVLSHEVTLGAPALFAEAMNVPSNLVRDAVLAHLLAVIDAFGNDRIEDEQVLPTPDLMALLGRMRKERDGAVARLRGDRAVPMADYSVADSLSLQAMRRERDLLVASKAVDMATYERTSLDKQGAGVVASVALARSAGWSERRVHAVRRTLESIAMGLQIYDDVVDWEDDLSRGGAWAVSLMRSTLGPPASQPVTPKGAAPLRPRVLQSGVLLTMLRRAVMHMRAGRRRAAALGAGRVAAWAASREQRFESLAAAEKRSAGYVARAHALSAWAGEVLA